MQTECEFSVLIDRDAVAEFAHLSGDKNPIHLSADFAKATTLQQPIAHGFLLATLASRVLGMHIPGEGCVILDANIRFPKPLFAPKEVLVQGKLKHYSSSANAGVVSVVVQDAKGSETYLWSEVSFTSVRQARPIEAESEEHLDTGIRSGDRATVLVTGGTGGVGTPIIDRLLRTYNVVSLSRRSRISRQSSALRHIVVDLDDQVETEKTLSTLDPVNFYAVLHMSGVRPRRKLISEDISAVQQQLHHAVTVPLLLAKWLRQPNSGVRRLILLGSTAGTKRPLASMGAYSLAKSCTDVLPGLLALDTAAQECTVNTVALGPTEVGINEGMTKLELMRVLSRQVQGKFVNDRDLGGLLDFLLSSTSQGVNGTVLTVDGGSVDG